MPSRVFFLEPNSHAQTCTIGACRPHSGSVFHASGTLHCLHSLCNLNFRCIVFGCCRFCSCFLWCLLELLKNLNLRPCFQTSHFPGRSWTIPITLHGLPTFSFGLVVKGTKSTSLLLLILYQKLNMLSEKRLMPNYAVSSNPPFTLL